MAAARSRSRSGSADLADDEARVASVRDVLDTVLGRGRGVDPHRRERRVGCAAGRSPCADWAIRDRVRRAAVSHVGEMRELGGSSTCPSRSTRRSARPPTRSRPGPRLRRRRRPQAGSARRGGRHYCGSPTQIDVPVVVSGSLDSSVGLDVAVAAAAALDDLPFACGLGTGALLAADVVETSPGSRGRGRVDRPHGPGPRRAARGARSAVGRSGGLVAGATGRCLGGRRRQRSG